MSGRIQYTVQCPCGAGVTLDARGFGRNLPCPKCKGTIVVAWGRDKMNTQTIPVIVRHVPGPGQPARPLAPKGETLRTKVLPQAKFFDCVCGTRNVLMGKGAGATIPCSGCDRVHVLEGKEEPERRNGPSDSPGPAAAKGPMKGKTALPAKAKGAPPPPPPAKSAPPPPPPPPAPARKLRLGEILCKCGEILPPRTSKTGREFECKACGRKGHVVPGQDEKGLPKIDTVFTHEPAAAALYKPPPPPAPPPAGAAAQWTCPCGTPVSASEAMSGKLSACPSCGRAIRVDKRHAPHSTMTLMKPVFVEPGAACPCGEELTVGPDRAGQVIVCGACGRELEVVAKNGFVRLRERASP